jgi:hypothetical protein
MIHSLCPREVSVRLIRHEKKWDKNYIRPVERFAQDLKKKQKETHQSPLQTCVKEERT